MFAKIEIVDYDPRWPQRFKIESAKICAALGDVALRIEHSGSTSVPGLSAKPIIDIILEVANSANELSYVRQLEAAGYRIAIREPDWHEHRLLKGRDPDVNLRLSEGLPRNRPHARFPRLAPRSSRRPPSLRGKAMERSPRVRRC